MPLEFQSNALYEAWRVLKAHGILFIIEPIYRKGSIEEIECLYHDESEARHGARNTVGAITNGEIIMEYFATVWLLNKKV